MQSNQNMSMPVTCMEPSIQVTALKRFLIASVALVMLVMPFTESAAADIRPFTDETFAALQAEGRPILVDIYASWCPTCRQQARILDELLAEDAFAGLVVLKLDWDAQRGRAREFGAPRQSTFIVFRGGEERGRSVADTRKDGIRSLLSKAMAD